MLRSGGVKGLGADHCAAALLVGPSRPRAVTRARTVHSARRRGANGWCGRAGWRPHHVQNPASGNQTAASSMEQGPTDRSETATPAEAGLGHSCSARARGQLARPGVVQPRSLDGWHRPPCSATSYCSQAWSMGRSIFRHGNTPRTVRDWVSVIGLDPSGYGTHSLRRPKAALIYRKTGNLRAVQLLLGHTKVDSTVRYLGVEHDDALSIAGKIDISGFGGRQQSSAISDRTLITSDRSDRSVPILPLFFGAANGASYALRLRIWASGHLPWRADLRHPSIA